MQSLQGMMPQPPLGAPQAGIGPGPQMPPQQPPQQVGPQGADPMAMLAQLKSMPDAQLQQMVAGKHPLGSFALAMLNGRNQERKAAQAKQMQQVASQPPVAQRVMQETSLLDGIAALPTGQAIPQRYAEGGVVGDDVPTAESWYDKLIRGLGALNRNAEAGWARDRAMWSEGAPVLVQPELPPVKDWTLGDAVQWLARPGEKRDTNGVPVPPAAVARPYRLEGADVYEGQPIPARAAPVAVVPAKTAPVVTAPASTARTGIAALSSAAPFQVPAWKDPSIGAPPANMTPEQRAEYQKQMVKELTDLYGPDVAQKYAKMLEEERQAVRDREPRSREEAWLTAGLKMMQGKSRHGLINIGAGGEAGVAQYRADRTEADRELNALRDRMQAADLAAQQRSDSLRSMALTQAAAQDARMQQARAERIGINQGEMKYGLEGAKLGIENKTAEAHMLTARAHMAQVEQMAIANGLTKEANAITATRGKIDAAVKERMAELNMSLIGKTPQEIDAVRNRIEREEYNKELNRNPKFAQLMGVGGKSITAKSAGLD